MVNSQQQSDVPFHSIAIVGTGFSGLGMAIRLKQKDFHDFVIFERANEVGGTWRDNQYPGCACDVESYLYSFSFAPNPDWSRMFSPQKEIWAYLQRCAERFHILPHIRFQHEVKEAKWDDTEKRWEILTQQGVHYARFLVTGAGALCEPKIPEIPGIESFQGKIMHSARWDHDHVLDGEEVAVVGTGASTIQFLPRIQPKLTRLYLFQRTPPWIVPSLDRPITARQLLLVKRIPFLQKLWRLRIYLTREAMGIAFRRTKMLETWEKIAVRHLKRAIHDETLRAKLTPGYRIGCKRILISNDYYPALARENVELVTDPIREIRPHSIVTRDGKERKVNTLIFGTGFQVMEMPFARRIRGVGGRLLGDVWQGSPRAHLGTTVTGFPNLFFLVGPNTGLGHSSIVMIIESQIEHVLRALKFLKKKRGIALDPRAEAQDKFNELVDDKMKKTVWVTGGCISWYLDPSGRNSSLWPSSVGAFRRRVGRFNPADYHITRSPATETTSARVFTGLSLES